MLEYLHTLDEQREVSVSIDLERYPIRVIVLFCYKTAGIRSERGRMYTTKLKEILLTNSPVISECFDDGYLVQCFFNYAKNKRKTEDSKSIIFHPHFIDILVNVSDRFTKTCKQEFP